MKSASAATVDHAEQVGIYLSWVPPGHAKDARDALAALVAERDQLRRERDDFEQRLHAYKSGEIA